MDTKKLKNDLEKIIDICNDGVNGYEKAADKIEDKDESLKTLFLRFSQQRKGFIENIKTEGIRLGIEFKETGTVKGFFHRTWLTAKANFASNEKEKVINEAMTGEKEALEVYAKVVSDNGLPEYLRDTLKEQQHLIKIAIQQLNDLKAE
ncbi:MAG TPA: PA2169 family four-helix-bundle protein [Prolixibacteraceae bacterium]|nr:PA2169 family four-helix-bundle protein [Prolixibacteraceae bacterium]